MKKIALIFNRYYLGEGQAYVKNRLTECLSKKNIQIIEDNFFASSGEEDFLEQIEAVIFWNKDVVLARHFENNGIKVFNCSKAIELCDCKIKTYQHIASFNIPLISTIFAPLSFTKQSKPDKSFLDFVESKLGFPLIAKLSVSSLGKGVFLLEDRQQLDDFFVEHSLYAHMYQKCIKPVGTDYRVYTIGAKAVVAVERKNEKSFISNIELGGVARIVDLDEELIELSQKIATALKLDYGAIDFLKDSSGKYYFLEANSNAYFRAVEGLGVNIAEPLVEYICKKIMI